MKHTGNKFRVIIVDPGEEGIHKARTPSQAYLC